MKYRKEYWIKKKYHSKNIFIKTSRIESNLDASINSILSKGLDEDLLREAPFK